MPATAADVPARFDIAINDRAYMIDWAADRFAGPVSLKVTRNQADTAGKAGESSLAREGLYRRTITSWHHGAGQVLYDDETADPYRFRRSLHIDPWTPGRLRPLGGLARRAVPFSNVGHIDDGSGTTNQMVLYNGIGYVTGGTNNASLYPTWDTSVVGATVPNGFMSLCSNGATIYAADKGGGGTGGTIYTTTGGGGAATSYKTGAYYLVRWALGRLWAANATQLVNVTSGSTETVAYTDTTTNWTWTDVVAGNGGVLASGYDQSSSSVVFTGLLPDGTGITPGYVVLDMPAGEKILSMHSYLGYVLLGTNKGVRVCKHDGGSSFTPGPLIDIYSIDVGDVDADLTTIVKAPSTAAVRCFASFDRFVYFGWSFYDWTGQTGSTESSGNFWSGLGRLDLSQMNAPLQPAYATDVMAKIENSDNHTTGEVTGCAVDTYGTPTFVVTSNELYTGSLSGTPTKSTYVYTTGQAVYLRTGRITLGLDDLKVFATARFRHDVVSASSGQFGAYRTIEGGTRTLLGTSTYTSTAFTAANINAVSETMEIEVYWTGLRSATQQTVFDIRLDGWPSPPRVERWQIPLLLYRRVETHSGVDHEYDSLITEMNAMRSLASPSGRSVVTMKLLGQTYSVVVDDWEFNPERGASPANGELQGVLLLTVSSAVT